VIFISGGIIMAKIDDLLIGPKEETYSTAGPTGASGQKSSVSGDAAGKGRNKKTESFDILVRGDAFNINIYGSFDSSALKHFQIAISGLLYVTPLRVVLNFYDREKIKINILNSLSECINQIKETGGTIKLISREAKPEDGLMHQTVYNK
jgi:hypothetical protein